MKKHDFVIIKTPDGKYITALRKFPEHPLATHDTKDAAVKRLKQYLKNVKENER